MDDVGTAIGCLARRQIPEPWLTRQPRISPDRLPLQVDLSPFRLGAVIVCVAGVLVLVSFWQVLGHVLLHDRDPVILAAAAASVFIGAGLIAGGLLQLYRRQFVTYGATGVEVSQRNLTGPRHWSAQYRDYAGVLQREHTVRRKNSSATYQIIQLVHADPAYDLPLYVAMGDALPRQRWETLAQRFALPALQLDDGRVVSRPPGALDAPLAEQVRAGHVASRGAAQGPPPPGVDISHDPVTGGRRIELRRGRVSLPGYAAMALFALPFIAAGFLHPSGWALAVTGVGLLAGLGWVCWKDATSPRALIIARDRLESHDSWRWTAADAVALDMAEIEAVRVRLSSTAGLVVVIESDRGTLHVGRGLSRAELTWLRDYLIATIATAQSRAGRPAGFAPRG